MEVSFTSVETSKNVGDRAYQGILSGYTQLRTFPIKNITTQQIYQNGNVHVIPVTDGRLDSVHYF